MGADTGLSGCGGRAGRAMLLLAALLDGGASESCEANFGQV